MGGFYRGWLVAGAISLAAASAKAGDTKLSFPPCTTTATDADRKAAQGAFLAGHGSFNEGDYQTAITYWRDAYRRDCTAHLLLVNLARAYELLGDRPNAVTALETYLERKPDATDADQIHRRIDNLKSQMAALPAPAATPSSEPVAAAPAPVPAPVADVPVETRSRSAVPLFVAGAGGVVAIIGLAVVGGGASKVADAEKACPDRQNCSQDTADAGNQGRSQERAGGAILGTGLVVGAGGLLWWLLSAPSSRTATTPSGADGKHAQVLPALGSSFAGIAVKGSF
jgi:tetratricopeptide (TPR) repeat protein